MVLSAIAIAGCGGSAPNRSTGLGAPPRTDPRVDASFPNTTNTIGVGLAFDHTPAGVPAAVRGVDYVFGADFLDWRLAPDPGVSHNDSYLPLDTDADPQDVAGHSLTDWQATHPGWIVYRCDRKTPAYYGAGNRNVPLDFSNPAVQNYDAHEAETLLAQGDSGVTFDDFSFTNGEARCGVYRHGTWMALGYPPRWKRNARYDWDVIAWLRNVRRALLRAYPNRTLGVNINFQQSGMTNLSRAAPYLDMVFNESGFTDYGAHDLSGSAWWEEVHALEFLNREGLAWDANGIVEARSNAAVTPAELNWVLGNYLLVRGAHSYTYVYAGNHDGYTGSPSQYGTYYDRPQYHIPIGHPVSPRESSDGLQLRFYSGGLVIVNPSATETLNRSLKGVYRDMFGGIHRQVTLPPTSAIVLLTQDAKVPRNAF